MLLKWNRATLRLTCKATLTKWQFIMILIFLQQKKLLRQSNGWRWERQGKEVSTFSFITLCLTSDELDTVCCCRSCFIHNQLIKERESKIQPSTTWKLPSRRFLFLATLLEENNIAMFPVENVKKAKALVVSSHYCRTWELKNQQHIPAAIIHHTNLPSV